ncbi:hypothetical protein [Microbacterium terricola]|uniref:Uncharacterized protein n=1 Tax=Microbacterium terricola TaxID=344163 RepID=A0ABM8E1H3_9MICO|nr:hypothetical protein [Microbacterium terricola]UYK40623.1 hypothetical protein OAU46_02920 [Microbacterium terricola]BDV31645.1 hypothetical protein Microterr_23050 [Microbacterium terricola]
MSDPRDDSISTTENEFEAPGANYPDSGKADAAPRDEPPFEPATPIDVPVETTLPEGADPRDHHGQDGTRNTLTAGQAQHEMAGQAEQNVPVMSQNNATEDEKFDGIVAQTRMDVANEPLDRIAEVLHQRLEQAGISLSDEEIGRLAERVAAP